MHSLESIKKSSGHFNVAQQMKIVRPLEGGRELKYIVQVYFQKLFFDGEVCLAITLNDVTDMEKNVALRAKNKMLNTMQQSISHELLTPLKCIGSIVDLI